MDTTGILILGGFIVFVVISYFLFGKYVLRKKAPIKQLLIIAGIFLGLLILYVFVRFLWLEWTLSNI